MEDKQDNDGRDSDGCPRRPARTHLEQLEFVVVVTACIALLVGIAGGPLVDSTGVHSAAAVLSPTVLLRMIIRRLLNDDPNGDDDF
jgi:hypothetical protein